MEIRQENLGYNQAAWTKSVAVVEQKLPAPPTSSKFDPSRWIEALNEDVSESMEKELIRARSWIGSRLYSLRKTFPHLFRGFSPHEALRHSIGYVNAVYIKNRTEFEKAQRSEAKRLGVKSPLLGHVTRRIEGTDQIISEDHLVTTTVDALSHALFSAGSADPSRESDLRPEQEVARAFNFANFEFVYRSTWLQVKWEGYRIEERDSTVSLLPPTKKYGAWWSVWDVRRQNMIVEQISVMGDRWMGHLSRGDVPTEVLDIIPQKYVSKANWRKGGWALRTSEVNPKSKQFRSAVISGIGLREVSLLAYIKEVIPRYVSVGLTLGHVLKTWHVIEWALESISKSTERRVASQSLDQLELSLSVSRTILLDIIVECANLTKDQADCALDFLTIDINNTSYLFNKGVWALPIIQDPEHEGLLHFIMPVFCIGNIVRAFENWIEIAKFARDGELKGSNFELTVYREITQAAKKSNLSVTVQVFGPNLTVRGEEIDGLLRVGSTLFVLECKNILTPGDSLERHNVVKRLRKGASQAERKAALLAGSLDMLNEQFGILPSSVSEVVGLVVTASPYGVGLNFGSVAVVDLSYLAVLVETQEFVSAMATKGGKTYQELTHLYKPFNFSPAALHRLIRTPFVQQRYFDALRWTYEPFPSGIDGIRFMLPFAFISPESDAEQAKRLFALAE